MIKLLIILQKMLPTVVDKYIEKYKTIHRNKNKNAFHVMDWNSGSLLSDNKDLDYHYTISVYPNKMVYMTDQANDKLH